MPYLLYCAIQLCLRRIHCNINVYSIIINSKKKIEEVMSLMTHYLKTCRPLHVDRPKHMLRVLKRTISNKVSWVRSFVVTLCSLGYLSNFFVICWFFSKSTFSKNSLKNTIWVSNRLDSICLKRLWAEYTGWQWVKHSVFSSFFFLEKYQFLINVILDILCTTLIPKFCLIKLQDANHKQVFASRLDWKTV